MKNKRTIIIKNPHLRNIRNNFRNLILETHKSIENKLLDKKSIISRDIFENPGKDTETLHEQIGILSRELQTLDQQINESIVICPVCFKSDKDMTYNPVRKTWYCTDCYEVLQKGNIERGTPEEFP